jgi:hypothetical protein
MLSSLHHYTPAFLLSHTTVYSYTQVLTGLTKENAGEPSEPIDEKLS